MQLRVFIGSSQLSNTQKGKLRHGAGPRAGIQTQDHLAPNSLFFAIHNQNPVTPNVLSDAHRRTVSLAEIPVINCDYWHPAYWMRKLRPRGEGVTDPRPPSKWDQGSVPCLPPRGRRTAEAQSRAGRSSLPGRFSFQAELFICTPHFIRICHN